MACELLRKGAEKLELAWFARFSQPIHDGRRGTSRAHRSAWLEGKRAMASTDEDVVVLAAALLSESKQLLILRYLPDREMVCLATSVWKAAIASHSGSYPDPQGTGALRKMAAVH
jgi:hypothetical protein